MRKKRFTGILALALVCSMILTPTGMTAHAEDDSAIAPHEAVYGYYVDAYRNNMDSNKTPETNPSIGLLSAYNDFWRPGSTWYDGEILNESVITYNFRKTYEIALSRTEEEAQNAYTVETGKKERIVLEGLGEYKDQFIELSGIGTNETQWSPKRGDKYPMYWTAHIARFMKSSISSFSSTSPAKNYFDCPRPYRWNTETMEVITAGYNASLLPVIEPFGYQPFYDDEDSGGFPSGHTNEIHLIGYGLAYAFPWKFQDVLMTMAEAGNYRIVAGVHSCLDVMGGRMNGTALAASVFVENKAANNTILPDAYNGAYETLFKDEIPAVATLADYETYQKNLEQFTYYLTYDFEPIADTTQAMRVPKGAESILETRLPYLDDTQRRYVIYTTGLPSGYPLLDDAEGWGRVNYYKAAAGYGAFVTDVVVNMDASLGAYNASDSWLNDISGDGSLTLQGTGRLALVGKNTFTGGVTIEGGELVMVSDTALGAGNVKVAGGVLSETVDGAAKVAGNFEQTAGTLKLTVDSADDVLTVAGIAKLGGTLIVEIAEGAEVALGTAVLSAGAIEGSFDCIEVRGAEGYSAKVQENAVVLVSASEVPDTTSPTGTPEEPGQSEGGNMLPLYVIIVGLGVVAGVVAARMKRKNK